MLNIEGLHDPFHLHEPRSLHQHAARLGCGLAHRFEQRCHVVEMPCIRPEGLHGVNAERSQREQPADAAPARAVTASEATSDKPNMPKANVSGCPIIRMIGSAIGMVMASAIAPNTPPKADAANAAPIALCPARRNSEFCRRSPIYGSRRKAKPPGL